jgi:hypothetical protein
MIKNKVTIIFLSALALVLSANAVIATSTPAFNLVNNTSTVSINVTGADPYATVNFYYPNPDSSNNSVNASYVSIGIGQTDSSGSFNVSVAPNSYGLSGGMQVYVTVDGASSSHIVWPTSSVSTNQSGSLQLSQQNVTLTVGGTATVIGMNTSNNLTVQSNSNNSVVAAFTQSSNNTVIINALSVGTSIVSVCAGTTGCSTVNVSIVAPTQTITFSQSPVYVALGQSPKSINIYGGSDYTLSNSNKDSVSASISGSSLLVQGLVVGQVTLSVCAPSWICGNVIVNSVSSGTNVPYQADAPAPTNSDFTQPPQLSSLSISSTDSRNLFFGANSIITVIFKLNQTVNSLQAKIAGQQVSADQGTDGSYSILYRATGSEILPLQVAISYTNPSGLAGQTYFSIGNNASVSPSSSITTTTTASTPSTAINCPVGLTCTPTTSASSSNSASSGYTFNNYLYIGMNNIGDSNPDVVALQNRLIKDGLLSSGSNTGYFGPLTKTAVEKYQTNNGLSSLGVVGPATRNLLNEGI